MAAPSATLLVRRQLNITRLGCRSIVERRDTPVAWREARSVRLAVLQLRPNAARGIPGLLARRHRHRAQQLSSHAAPTLPQPWLRDRGPSALPLPHVRGRRAAGAGRTVRRRYQLLAHRCARRSVLGSESATALLYSQVSTTTPS